MALRSALGITRTSTLEVAPIAFEIHCCNKAGVDADVWQAKHGLAGALSIDGGSTTILRSQVFGGQGCFIARQAFAGTGRMSSIIEDGCA